ncbi:MAG TPA: methyltransferase domain-containing protein [Stellaceae bacterium]|nr:methyltransferase domain-containing protein [Stellaceae bacterium]
MVSRSEIVDAYRFILGREPENEAVIEDLYQIPDWQGLRQAFLSSLEYQANTQQAGLAQLLNDYILAAPNRVDTDISEEQFGRLLAHVQRSWERLGEEKPYWSVLVDASYLPENIDRNIDSFYRTGPLSWMLFECAAARAGRMPAADGVALELGCGVGRVTPHLAQYFREVIACDISLPHLDIARTHLTHLGVNNVRLVRVDSIERLQEQGPLDFFYSVIVLQHNPPPIIARLLEVAFANLKPGGIAYFQLPVAAKSYEFVIETYLDRVVGKTETMEMHVLPQKYLFQLMQRAGMRLLDIQRENWTGPLYHSLSILCEKAV